MARLSNAALIPKELYKQSPPLFGHEMLSLFGFDPKYVNMNSGSYGSLPLPVRAACDELTTVIESNPDKFFRMDGPAQMNRTRERIAELIGADADECVLVNNTSHGIATVLRNFSFSKTDVLVGATTTYHSISQTIKYLADIPPHPEVSTFALQFPTTPEAILADFREHIHKLKQEKGDLGQDRKIIAIIDTITKPGVLLPWVEMVEICRNAGVWSVVDAAHSLGQELDINLSVARPDFWISNCHKWLYAKRGCAVLYVPKRNQHIIKSTIPTSLYYLSPQDKDYKGPQNFVTLFEWTGTIDRVPLLSINAALDFRAWLGGEHKINEYTHSLAIKGGNHLVKRLGTSLFDPQGSMILNMVIVELPIPGYIPDSEEVHNLIQDTLLLKWNTYAPQFHINGKWWIRVSAQIYNEISDFDLLADAFLDVAAQVVERHAK